MLKEQNFAFLYDLQHFRKVLFGLLMLEEVRKNNKVTYFTLKFLLENCAEEMNYVRITTSCSSLELVRRDSTSRQHKSCTLYLQRYC